MSTQKPTATYRLKTADLDPKMLAQAMSSAQLGESPGTVEFKTPGGHTVSSPYSDSVIEHHIKRLGGPNAYYEDLGRTLAARGARVDADVERDRDELMGVQKKINVLAGVASHAPTGALVGWGLGALAKRPGAGALIGGTLGAIGGGIRGALNPVVRDSTPINLDVNDIQALYKEPEHLQVMKKEMNRLQNQVAENEARRRMDRNVDHLFSIANDYDPYYARYPYRRPGYYY